MYKLKLFYMLLILWVVGYFNGVLSFVGFIFLCLKKKIEREKEIFFIFILFGERRVEGN